MFTLEGSSFKLSKPGRGLMKNLKNTTLRSFLLTVLTLSSLLVGATAYAEPVTNGFVVHSCAKGYYKNTKGACTKSPTKAPVWPSGASAKCADGSYSFSQSRRGTCSHHGGVAVWGN